METVLLNKPFETKGFDNLKKDVWIQNILSRRFLYHFVFWATLFLFNAISLGYVSGFFYENILCFGLRFPFIIVVSYINMYYLLPEFYYKYKIVNYLVLIALSILVFNTANMGVFYYLFKNGSLPAQLAKESQFNEFNFGYKAFFMMSIVVFTCGIKLSKNHFLQQQKADLIDKERLATELTMLKSQIQPHFFFNTLNNLYALTLKKSDLAPEVVLKLSDFMSYVLYETDQERTLLTKEINYIKSYMDLESLRFGKQPVVTFEISGKCGQIFIPPLLLLPFIENSFKHSLSTGAQNIEISINLVVARNLISLVVTNPCMDPQPNKKGGIGLRNVRRRLDLIYDKSYRLVQTRLDNKFTTKLEIPIVNEVCSC